MKLPRLHRRSLAALAIALTATLLVPAQPASAAPVITSSLSPQSGPTAGGTPVRIYGTGFTGGVVDVEFDNVNATDFKVIDATLITAVVPAASGGSGDNNTFVDVEVTVGANTYTETDAFYYTNATFTVAGNGTTSPFDAGDAITTTLDGYKATTSVVVPQFNPLLVYAENFPNFPFGPPPYAEILDFSPTTDSNGDLVDNVSLANPFDGSNNSNPVYDANIACPVNQTTVNFLGNSDSISLTKPAYSGHCMVANGQYGTGTLERAIDMTGDPTPAAATLVLGDTTADVNQSVSVAGINWNANPFFGSSKLADNPGETTVTVKICDYVPSPDYCSTTVGNAAVDPTRYIYNNGTGVFDFSGANLHGGITVGSDLPTGCSTCYVQVSQNRPVSGTITKVWPITINN